MIVVKNVCKTYSQFPVLSDVSLTIAEGEIYGLLGASGAGKSTLLRCLNGLESYDQGSISLNGIEIGSLTGKDLREVRKKMGMIFQDYALLERVTVFDNVFLPLQCWGKNTPQMRKKVCSLLDMVGLADKAKMYPKQLSGGQKQRVAIARALSLDPEVLLCDEATSALDPTTAEAILELLMQVNRELHITMVIVTHQMSVVKKICSNLSILENSSIALTGEVSSIFSRQPEALKRLMGTTPVSFPFGKTCFSLFYTQTDFGSSLLSEFSAKTHIPYLLLDAQTHDLGGKKSGQFYIAVDTSEENEVASYLRKERITFTVTRNSEISCGELEHV